MERQSLISGSVLLCLQQRYARETERERVQLRNLAAHCVFAVRKLERYKYTHNWPRINSPHLLVCSRSCNRRPVAGGRTFLSVFDERVIYRCNLFPSRSQRASVARARASGVDFKGRVKK